MNAGNGKVYVERNITIGLFPALQLCDFVLVHDHGHSAEASPSHSIVNRVHDGAFC